MALAIYRQRGGAAKALVLAGGVAANSAIRTTLARFAQQSGLPLIAPPVKLCTDNGAMIAWAGIEKLRLGRVDDLAAPARARWPLDPKAERARNNKA
jgi:N6-L-threonylcarbamoyladenine synthase